MREEIKRKVQVEKVVAVKYELPAIFNRIVYYINFTILKGEIVEIAWPTRRNPDTSPYRLINSNEEEWYGRIELTIQAIFRPSECINSNFVDFKNMIGELNKDGLSYNACMSGINKAIEFNQIYLDKLKSLVK